jgi:hypothetical protein
MRGIRKACDLSMALMCVNLLDEVEVMDDIGGTDTCDACRGRTFSWVLMYC